MRMSKDIESDEEIVRLCGCRPSGTGIRRCGKGDGIRGVAQAGGRKREAAVGGGVGLALS